MISSCPIRAVSVAPVLPGDKSITHRAYIVSLLGRGTYRVGHPNRGEDCQHTLEAARALGVTVRALPEGTELTGLGGRTAPQTRELDLGNSGTGLRLLLGVLAGQPHTLVLGGDASLSTRPMRRVLDPLEAMGATAHGETPPVEISGGGLKGIDYELPVASAQVKSALLLAALQAEGATRLTGKIQTRDHTERLLEYLGVPLERSPESIVVQGGHVPALRNIEVPGDPSAAAFYLALPGIVSGSTVRVRQMLLNPGRIAYLSCLESMGLEVEIVHGQAGPEPSGDVVVSGSLKRGLKVEESHVPHLIDELPILAALAAFAPGESFFRGLEELRHKESDRLHTTAQGLGGLGAIIEVREDGWRVQGSEGNPLPGGAVASRGDHRIGMSLLMAGLNSQEGVRILDEPGIETSDPHFADNLKTIMGAGS